MADSLDDFFARKDRAKKTRGKKAVAEEPAGRTEETVKEKRKEKEKAAAAQPAPNQHEEESEWKEVEYEKDYSGLKIHSMTIRDKEEEIREQKLQEACEQAESKKNDPSGPWKTSGADTPVQEPVREPKRSDREDVVQKARYVPPGMRNQPVQGNGPLAPSRLKALRSGKAPEIENQAEFPSLGAAVPAVEADQKPVPSVNSWKDTNVRSAVRTENKFDALSEN